ncbi:MAG TPA: hydrogenase maturation protease [Hyphomicrobiales bacterium]|jgi:hydrogenase maturation protease
MTASRDALILGLGNRLMSDDAAGPLVIKRLASLAPDGTRMLDGGTLGIALLPEIEASEALIVVDAAELGASPGAVAVFHGADMDRMLGGVKKTAHEIALSDLIAAAKLTGACPPQRALVAVQPETIALGLEPSQCVASAIPQMVAEILLILERWRSEARAA